MDPNPYEPSQVASPLAPTLLVEGRGTATEVEFDLTFDDFVAFNRDHTYRVLPLKAIRYGLIGLVWLAIPTGIAAYLFTNSVATDVAFALIFVAVGFSVLFPLTAFLSFRLFPVGNASTSWVLRWMMSRGDTTSLFGRHLIRLNPDELYERSPQAETHCTIKIVKQLITTPDHLFIYISPVQAFIVPRRAFWPPETFIAFVATLEQYSGVKHQTSQITP